MVVRAFVEGFAVGPILPAAPVGFVQWEQNAAEDCTAHGVIGHLVQQGLGHCVSPSETVVRCRPGPLTCRHCTTGAKLGSWVERKRRLWPCWKSGLSHSSPT